jgi:hypothetical protein
VLDVRSPLIWGGPAVGAVLGVTAWLLFGGSPVRTQLSDFEARLADLNIRPTRSNVVVANAAADALSHPIFSVGGTALADAVVRLDGLAITPRRAAALVSINGDPAEWMERGATKGGITLQQVLATKIVIDTATGPREVGLNDKAPVPSATPSGSQPSTGDAPAGYRLPPPPASAPAPHR